jgi:hypothetical protein
MRARSEVLKRDTAVGRSVQLLDDVRHQCTRNVFCHSHGVGMSSTARRAISDFMMFAGGVVILLFALIVFDDRFRQQLSTAAGSSDAMTVGRQVNELALVAALIVSQFARDQFGDNWHMAVFTTAAVVLVIFLTRL